MHAPAETQWPALDDLVGRVIEARRAVAEAQASEAALLAEAVTVITDRTELLRREATKASQEATKASQEATKAAGYRASQADLPLREVSLELAMAMRASDRTVQSRISDAWGLCTQFPTALAAWTRGEIDAGHAWAIAHTGASLPQEHRERFAELALDVAATESPTRTRHALKAIAAQLCPEAFAEAARAAADERDVRLYDLEEGMARLMADLPAPLAHAIYDQLTARARATLAVRQEDAAASADPAQTEAAQTDAAQKHAAQTDAADGDAASIRAAFPASADPADPDTQTFRTEPRAGAEPRRGYVDPRTMGQVRADLFCELLLTGIPGSSGPDGPLASIDAHIQVLVPALTLAGDDSGGPALLAGYGPIDSDLARRLAARAPGWDRVFTDPCTGATLAVDRYRPNAAITRFLAARDERCRAPGCTRPVHRCDHDHSIPASQGGSTCAGNLANFCRRHHTCKHQQNWRVIQLGNGVIEWRGPTGRRYVDRPPSMVRFVPAAGDDPPDVPPDRSDERSRRSSRDDPAPF